MKKLRLYCLISLLFLAGCTTLEVGTPVNERFAETPVRLIDDINGVSMVMSADDLFYSPIDPMIRAEYFVYLNAVVATVQEYPDLAVMVTGHSDQIMTRADRLVFSEKYAREVTDYLLTRGVNPNRIVRVSGESSYLPIEDPRDPVGRHWNRRVEVTIAGYPEGWTQNCDHCLEIPKIEGEIK